MDRKQFLAFLSGQLLLLSPLLAKSEIKKKSYSEKKSQQVLVGGYYVKLPTIDKNKRIAEDWNGNVQIIDLETLKIQSIVADFFPHSFAQNKLNTNMIASAAKWAHRAGVFDIKNSKQTIKLTALAGERFFGHVQFDKQGILYLTAATEGQEHGFIHSYDPNNGKHLQTFETGGRAPHDFYFVDENTICVANASEYTKNKSVGILSWIDIKKNKIINTYKVVEPNHLLQLDENNVAISSLNLGTEIGEFYKYNFKEKKITDSKSAKDYHPYYHNGEKLSLTAVNDNLLAVTTSTSEKVLFWNLKEGKLLAKSFSNTMLGLASKNNTVYVTNKTGDLTQFSVDKFGNTIGAEKLLAAEFSNSAHMKLMNI